MLKLLASAVALASCISAAQATPVGEFDGTFYVTSASAACPWQLHRKFHMLYFPPDIGANGPGTEFTLENLFGAGINVDSSHYSVGTGDIVGTTYVGLNGTGIATGDSFTFSSSGRITAQTPATIDDNTHALELIGNIKGFGYDPACAVRFDATLYSYPVP